MVQLCAAKGSNTQIAVIEESTYGVIPTITNGDMTELFRSNFSMEVDPEQFEDDSITSDGFLHAHYTGDVAITGSITVSIAHGQQNILWASALRNSWVSDQLKVGQLRKSFTLQVRHLDKSGMDYIFYGVRVTSVSTTVEKGITKATFGLMALGYDKDSGALDTAPTSPSRQQALMTTKGMVVTEGGSLIHNVKKVDLNIDLGMESDYSATQETPICVVSTKYRVSGNLVTYFDSAAQYNKFLTETETSLVYTTTDADGETLTINLPRMKFVTASKPIAVGGSIIATFGIVSMVNDAIDSPIVMTQS